MPRIFPVYLFTGEDEYRKQGAIDKLKKALLNGRSEALNFNVYEAGKCDEADFFRTLRSSPFLSKKRLVILKKAEKVPRGLQEGIIRYVTQPSPTACLVLKSVSGEIYEKIYGGVKDYIREVSFAAPDKKKLAGWIQKMVREKGKTIHPKGADLLKELKKDDITGLRTEIDKLITYAGKRAVVTRDDVELLVGISAPRGIFDFIHALARKDAKEALSVSRELLRARMSMPEILGMIGWQLRKIKKAGLLLGRGVPPREAGAACRVPPYYLNRFMREVGSFTAEELQRAIDSLLEADYRIKTGQAKPREALEILVIQICSGKKAALSGSGTYA